MTVHRKRSFATLIAVAIAISVPALSPAQTIDVKDAWLKRNCHDKGNADHPLANAEFEACIRKQVEGLPKLDPSRRELFGEKYDPAKYVQCKTRPGNRNNSACNVYILRRREWPEYWPEGAKKIKWPEAPKESVYRKGMTPREYWQALCKAEAGEFIANRMVNVDGFYFARPRGYVTDIELADRYVLEDPLAVTDVLGSERLENEFVQPYGGRFRFIETHKDGQLVRFYRGEPSSAAKKYQTARDGRFVRVPYVVQFQTIGNMSARYAISWRGIQRSADRENGIAGSEVVILDLRSGETLAIRRGFAFVEHTRSRLPWMSAQRCPDDRRDVPTRRFIEDVLRPSAEVNANIKQLEE